MAIFCLDGIAPFSLVTRRAPILIVFLTSIIACDGGLTNQTDVDGGSNIQDAGPEGPAPNVEFSEEVVTFTAPDGLILRGILRSPTMVAPTGAVLMISGSGPHPASFAADGQLGMKFGFSVPIFDDISRALLSVGFSALSFDNRGCGRFNRCSMNDYPVPSQNTTVYDQLNDAAAALDYLRLRPELNGRAMGILGHSLGGTLAAHLATNADKKAGVILVSTPAAPIDIVLEGQADFYKSLLLRMGRSEAEAQLASQDLFDLASAVKALRSKAAVGRLIKGTSDHYWKSWLEMSDAAVQSLKDSPIPKMVLAGTYDWNVQPREFDTWKTALEGEGNAKFALIPCVTHALNCVTNNDVNSLAVSDFGRSVDRRIVDSIISFVKEL